MIRRLVAWVLKRVDLDRIRKGRNAEYHTIWRQEKLCAVYVTKGGLLCIEDGYRHKWLRVLRNTYVPVDPWKVV